MPEIVKRLIASNWSTTAIENMVTEWHNGQCPEGVSLQEYMGLNHTQYGFWLCQNDTALVRVLRKKFERGDYEDANVATA